MPIFPEALLSNAAIPEGTEGHKRDAYLPTYLNKSLNTQENHSRKDRPAPGSLYFIYLPTKNLISTKRELLTGIVSLLWTNRRVDQDSESICGDGVKTSSGGAEGSSNNPLSFSLTVFCRDHSSESLPLEERTREPREAPGLKEQEQHQYYRWRLRHLQRTGSRRFQEHVQNS